MASERNRPPRVLEPQNMTPAELSQLLAELAEESERTIDDETPYPADTVFAFRPDTIVQSVRLNTADFDKIKVIAGTTDTPVSVLIRGWIKQGLASEENSSIEDSIERLSEELKRLRRLTKG
jgi:hypothetical protein